MRIGKSRLNLTANIRLSKNIFFGDGISGTLAGRSIFGTTSQALAISPQFAEAAATFGTTSAAQLPYLAQGANTFSLDHSATASSATFLLDEYPGAAAAYSVRLLSSTYSGPLVRIRKDTGGQPEKDFYPDSNNELSLNSGDGGGTTLGSWIGSNSGYIVTWYSQAGVSGRDATQSTASFQPQILSSGSFITDNGKPAIEYTSGDQELTLSLDFTETHSVFTVNNFSTTAKEIIGATQRYFIYRDATDTFYRLTNTGFTTFGGVITLNQQLLYVDKKTSTVALYENGNQIGTTQSTSGTSVVVDSLSGERSSFNFLGTMQEIIVYTSDESANKTEIETNINDFYTIY